MFSKIHALRDSKNKIRHTEEEGKKRVVSMEISKAGTKRKKKSLRPKL